MSKNLSADEAGRTQCAVAADPNKRALPDYFRCRAQRFGGSEMVHFLADDLAGCAYARMFHNGTFCLHPDREPVVAARRLRPRLISSESACFFLDKNCNLYYTSNCLSPEEAGHESDRPVF
jgi:hypothetical protein